MLGDDKGNGVAGNMMSINNISILVVVVVVCVCVCVWGGRLS